MSHLSRAVEFYILLAERVSQTLTALFMFHTSTVCRSLLQIDWPAPQDKKRECVAKGKNNQVTGMFASQGCWLSLPC